MTPKGTLMLIAAAIPLSICCLKPLQVKATERSRSLADVTYEGELSFKDQVEQAKVRTKQTKISAKGKKVADQPRRTVDPKQ